MMHGGGAEIPEDRLMTATQKRKTAELVALPLADLGAGYIADVVDVEEQQRAALRFVEGGAGAGQPVCAEPVEIDAPFEVDAGMSWRRDGTVPAPARVEGFFSEGRGGDGL